MDGLTVKSMSYTKTFSPKVFSPKVFTPTVVSPKTNGGDYGYGGNYESYKKSSGNDGNYGKGSDSDEAKALRQAQSQADFANRAANDASERNKQDVNNADQVLQRQEIRRSNESRQDTSVANKFKSDQSKLDRDKSSDEFTQNRYQVRANQAQDRANLEFSTNAANENLRQQRAAESSIKDRDIAANQQLAQLNSTTSIAGQQSQLQGSLAQSKAQLEGQLGSAKSASDAQIQSAQAAAKAQVTAALYGSRPGYQGY